MEENANIIADVENIGANIRKDYKKYTKILEEIYNNKKTSLDDYANELKNDIEKHREDAEKIHLENEANYIDEN